MTVQLKSAKLQAEKDTRGVLPEVLALGWPADMKAMIIAFAELQIADIKSGYDGHLSRLAPFKSAPNEVIIEGIFRAGIPGSALRPDTRYFMNITRAINEGLSGERYLSGRLEKELQRILELVEATPFTPYKAYSSPDDIKQAIDAVYGVETASRKLNYKKGGYVGLNGTLSPEQAKGGGHMGLVGSGIHLTVHNTAKGIGDAIHGLYACSGMTARGYEVTYYTYKAKWLYRSMDPLIHIRPFDDITDLFDGDSDTLFQRMGRNMNAKYEEKLKYAHSSKCWYIEQTCMQLPSLRSDAEWPVIYPRIPLIDVGISYSVNGPISEVKDYVVLAPYSAYAIREWPIAHWRRLAYLLGEKGNSVIVIGGPTEQKRFDKDFDGLKILGFFGSSPEWTCDTLLGAKLLIGNDSGMVHLSGLLGVKTIAIHSALPPEYLFDYTKVRSVTPNMKCSLCKWQYELGYNAYCNIGCSALHTISPEEVLDAFKKPLTRDIVNGIFPGEGSAGF